MIELMTAALPGREVSVGGPWLIQLVHGDGSCT